MKEMAGEDMIREIRKKLVILHNRQPFKDGVRDHLRQLEEEEWIFMHLRLSGSRLSQAEVEEIRSGGCILQATVEDHLMIQRLAELRQYIYRLTDMKADMGLQVLRDMHRIVTGGDGREDFRKSSPVLLEYGCTPMLPADIPQAMEELAAYCRGREEGAAGFMKAARVHNRLIEIYPFREGSEILARAAMYYCLVQQGYPLAPLTWSETEYNRRVMDYLKGGTSQTLAEELVRTVHRKLELMIQMISYDN